MDKAIKFLIPLSLILILALNAKSIMHRTRRLQLYLLMEANSSKWGKPWTPK